MKTRWSAATACLLELTLPAAPAEAQFPLTFAAGPLFATVSGADVESETGFFVAVGTAIPVSGGTVALTPFVGYTQRGWKEPDGEGKLTYIDVPVFLGARFPLAGTTTFNVSAGPRVSFQLSCEFEESGGSSEDCPEDEEKSLDFGLLGKVGLRFELSASRFLAVGVSYDLGLTDIFETTSGKNHGIYVYGGLTVLVGG